MESELESTLASHIGDHSLPSPDDSTLYVIFIPTGTAVTGPNGQSCTGYEGFHSSVVINGQPVPYAVVPTCPLGNGTPDLTGVEFTAAHEIIEGATDPQPLDDPAWRLGTGITPWTAVGGEVGDLCVSHFATYGDFTVIRSWSNTAAAAGRPPCIPVPDNEVLANVSPSSGDIQSIAAGTSVDVTITGWSTAPVADWEISAYPSSFEFTPSASLSRARINNGQTVTLTIGVPAGTPSGTFGSVVIYSFLPGRLTEFWPIGIQTQ
jgi:hypothetical protein